MWGGLPFLDPLNSFPISDNSVDRQPTERHVGNSRAFKKSCTEPKLPLVTGSVGTPSWELSMTPWFCPQNGMAEMMGNTRSERELQQGRRACGQPRMDP